MIKKRIFLYLRDIFGKEPCSPKLFLKTWKMHRMFIHISATFQNYFGSLIYSWDRALKLHSLELRLSGNLCWNNMTNNSTRNASIINGIDWYWLVVIWKYLWRNIFEVIEFFIFVLKNANKYRGKGSILYFYFVL